MTVLMGKIKSLGQEYAGSPRCFPVREYCNTAVADGTLLVPVRCMLKNCSLQRVQLGTYIFSKHILCDFASTLGVISVHINL
jgi:hypothetical protein